MDMRFDMWRPELLASTRMSAPPPQQRMMQPASTEGKLKDDDDETGWRGEGLQR